MATTSRKTVKSNPLDKIATTAKSKLASKPPKKTVSRAAKLTDTAQTAPAELRKNAVTQDAVKQNAVTQDAVKQNAVTQDSVTQNAVTHNAARVDAASSPIIEKTVSDNPAKPAVATIAAAAETEPLGPKNLSAEEFLAKEFTPNSSIVMIPSSLLEDDPFVDVHALHTVKTWSQWAVLGGLIPSPIVDVVAITGVQIKMIHALCKLYNVEFKKEAALAVVSGLVGGTLTTSVAGLGASFLGYLPVVGSLMKFTVQPALSYASTYALGRVFMRHFESKGTMADIDSKKLASYFKEQYARGRKMFKYEFKVQRTQNA